MTERTLGAKVGHLELLGHTSDWKIKEKSKHDSKDASKGRKSDQVVLSKGGSKKFG